MRVLLTALLILLMPMLKAQKNIFVSRTWVYEIKSIGGAMIDPNIQTEPIEHTPEYRLFIEPTKYGTTIKNATLYLRGGKYFAISFAKSEGLQTRLPDGTELVPKSAKKIAGGGLSVAIDFVKLPIAVKKGLEQNEAMISFMIKGKEYFIAVKKVEKRQIALP